MKVPATLLSETEKKSLDKLNELAVRELMKEEGIISNTLTGTNEKLIRDLANGAALSRSTIKWYYNPKYHYMSAFLSAQCEPDRVGLYLVRFQVEKIFVFGVYPKIDTLKIFQLGAK